MSVNAMKIGLAITTTPSRAVMFSENYYIWECNMPENAIITYVVDEGGAGVARAKNASLKLLESLGVTHYFLVDNDVTPLSKDWWKPFVESKENHLMYNFKLPGKPKTDMRELYRDDKIVAYSHTRGCFLYATQKVLDTVGGFDTKYYNSYEHADWTNRIHNAGLTTYRSMSPVNAGELLYCLDQDGLVQSSIKDIKRNHAYYRMNRNSKEYKEYKNG